MTSNNNKVRRGTSAQPVSVGDAPYLIAELHLILDNGFRRCRALAERMQLKLEQDYRSQLELLYIDPNSLKPVLRPTINSLYKIMTQTIFDVLRLLQPEDFNKKVNFYLLPGYHSHLINKRIFYQKKAGGPSKRTSYKSFGLGLTGGATGDPEEYYDCCHARWYHYATTPPPPNKDFLPASPYHWFAYQQPRITRRDLHNLVASLTFSRNNLCSEDSRFPEHKVLNLGEHSIDWGGDVAETLNGMKFVSRPKWKFPDRGDRKEVLDPKYDPKREVQLRYVRCLLISLWMHSVFENEEPEWLDLLKSELSQLELTSMLNAVELALDDRVACDWGDEQSKRPRFRTWTMINLHPLIAPPPTPLYGPSNHASRFQESSDVYRQTIGWATMFCSAPLGIPFISVVRQWIRTVYSMLRSAEVTVLLKNREPHARAAQMVRLFSHDSYRFMEESVGTVLRGVGNCSKQQTDYRKHIIQALRLLNTFNYTVSSALPHPEKLVEQREIFVKALNVGEKRLLGCIYRAADDIQKHRVRARTGTPAIVIIPKQPTISKQEASGITYVYCLLLVGELVRNYCRHGPPGHMARLSAGITDGELCIELVGRADNRPAGENFAILDNLLGALRVGEAKIEEQDEKQYRWRVTVQLQQKEPA